MSDIKLFHLLAGTTAKLQGPASYLEMLLHTLNERSLRISSRSCRVKEIFHA